MDKEAASLIGMLMRTDSGDEDAFRHLYKATSSRMMAVCMRVLNNRALAEEALQEAYIRVWHHAGEYHEERGTPLGWMMTIARYQCIDMLRRGDELGIDITAVQDQIHEKITCHGVNDNSLALDGCLQKLPEDQRSSILMSYYFGMTHEQLSASLSKPLGTIKSRVRRGLLSLRRCLAQ